jgi:hypothetical protein
MPARIVSDWGLQFAARIMKEFLCLLGINSNLTAAYPTGQWDDRAHEC